jgi:hypothetical protein
VSVAFGLYLLVEHAREAGLHRWLA